jgi:glycosyltransferase involved in cell wall biosynthesis
VRFHLLGLAHLPTSRSYQSCAYTQKVVKLSKMLMSLGHTVILYGTEESDAEATELVIVSGKATRVKCYGEYDWHREFFKHDPKDEAHQEFNNGAIREILLRKEPQDILLCPMGNFDKPIADAVGLKTVESGVGYDGIFAQHRVWESYVWMHHVYGMMKQENGIWFDRVIPNYFELSDFPYDGPPRKYGYYLYIGRLISRKGLGTAIEAVKKMGVPLIVAGQGHLENVDGFDFSHEKLVNYVGTVDAKQRFELMSHAKAVFCPTYYIGPFEGVAVEAQLCGTPVITTDWGAFVETVSQGVSGFRCRTLGEFEWAARHCDELSPYRIRKWAERYSTDVVKYEYQQYFEDLQTLWKTGWYESYPNRTLGEWRMRQGR